MAGNEPDARDLVQEAFARAFENHKRYDPEKPFEAWLFRILRNVYLDGVRRYEHRHVVSIDAAGPAEDSSWQDVLPGEDGEPVDAMLRRERDEMVQRALDSLPVHYRTAVTLCDIENLSYEEIGEIMMCPVGTVRSRIHEGRRLMKKAFETLAEKGRVKS